jgi:hypothetical protein
VSEPTIDDYCWLTGAEAARYLADLAEADEEIVRTANRLRRDLSPARTHLLLEQSALRQRAARKFSDADRLFFTQRGLEQASGEAVAAYKAERFHNQARVADLCCGIGGDLMALAARGAEATIGVDLNRVATLLAAANCRVRGLAAETRELDVNRCDTSEFAAWHVDPDRRAEGVRTVRLERSSPDFLKLDRLMASNENAAVKLAPAAVVSAAWEQRAELEWISHDRECRQLVAWFGDLAARTADAAGRRRATRVQAGSGAVATFAGQADQPIDTASQVRRYLLEPDPAVLAAHLTGALAAEHDLQAVAPNVDYLTSDVLPSSGLLAGFEVTDILPLDVRKLSRLLSVRGIGHLEIKKRAVPIAIERLRKQLRSAGEKRATLVVTPTPQGTRAILARRCSEVH